MSSTVLLCISFVHWWPCMQWCLLRRFVQRYGFESNCLALLPAKAGPLAFVYVYQSKLACLHFQYIFVSIHLSFVYILVTCSFSVSGPSVWNSLQLILHHNSDNTAAVPEQTKVTIINYTEHAQPVFHLRQWVACYTVYRVFNNDCTPSRAKTNKTLAKLFLCYNSVNKVTLLCKVSDWCVLLN